VIGIESADFWLNIIQLNCIGRNVNCPFSSNLIQNVCVCVHYIHYNTLGSCSVFADALHVTVVNATVVNISWTNETLYSTNSSDILQQNTSAYTIQFR